MTSLRESAREATELQTLLYFSSRENICFQCGPHHSYEFGENSGERSLLVLLGGENRNFKNNWPAVKKISRHKTSLSDLLHNPK